MPRPMSERTSLVDLTLQAFAARLAERTPTPGGGSVAAYLAAQGAALAAMAFRFTSGEKYAGVQAAMGNRADELDRLRERALDLVDRDTDAYDAVTAAYKLPKADPAQKSARTQAVQSALGVALEVPLETMRTAVLALRLCAEGAPAINPNLASDCATGAWCLWSAAESARLNVRINAASLADTELARARLAECEAVVDEARRLSEAARSAAGRLLG
jgi:formiminotetrahydrofolate cyclodeaminase